MAISMLILRSSFFWVVPSHSGKAAPILRKWCTIRSSDYTATEYKAEVAFTTTTMVTFMNELTTATGGAYRFESDTGRLCLWLISRSNGFERAIGFQQRIEREKGEKAKESKTLV